LKKRVLEILLFIVVIPSLLFALRGWSFPGGDAREMADRISINWQFFARAPLVIFVNRVGWLGLRNFGWSPQDVIALSSSVAGGVFLAGLWRISKNPRVWMVCLLSKVSFVFVGHVENYAWPYAASLWCFALLKMASESQGPIWPVWACAGLATLFHPMALMIWPGLLWGLPAWDRKRIGELVGALASVLLIYDFFFAFGNVYGFFQTNWVVPLFDPAGSGCPYTMFSWEHWKIILGFHLLTLPIGLTLSIWYGKSLFSGWKKGLMIAALITLGWSLVWFPGKGADDWDLFAWPALFVNLAGGLAWVEHRRGEAAPPLRSIEN
jgi:hypothetical protein